MRTTADRIRHAILFEIVGLVFLIGGGWLITGFDMHALGVIGVVSSVVATVWNYLYNLAFDHAMRRLRGSVAKTHPIRAVHAATGELLCPHTAVGVKVAQENLIPGVPMVTLATAHPAKFPEAVERATGIRPPLPAHLAALMAGAERVTRVENDSEALKSLIFERRTA